MSKYNNYAQRLDAAFREAREEYAAAFEKLQQAKADAEAAAHPRDVERRFGEHAAKKAKADAALALAQVEFNSVQHETWPAFNSEVAKLTKELYNDVKKNNIASPDAIDPNGLELLKSGILSVDDMAALADQYDDNPTMLRLVSKYSREMGDNEKLDPASRVGLYSIARATANGMGTIMQAWDNLTTVANIYSGQARGNDGPGYIIRMAENWDDSSVQDALEEF